MMTKQSTARKILVPVVIIAGAVALATLMIKGKTSPPKEPHVQTGALVEVLQVTPQDYPLSISASGTVTARQEISLEPQVSGKVVALGPRFASGAFFRKGELLLQIEKTDYRLAVEQAQASLARAEVELATTESQAAIARLEWDRLGLQEGEEANPLALYEPQLKNARANIASARAALDQARLNLQRTTIVAPFDARIRSEQVDIGQFVRSGSKLATLNGSAAAEVIVSIPLEDLPWLSIPDTRDHGAGSSATVALSYGRQENLWTGIIDRSLGEVDPRGRMLQVAVRVEDPYRLLEKESRPPYLEVGMFVNVRFDGPLLKQKIVLPRRALRDNRTVWVADKDNTLRIRPVEIERFEPEQVVLAAGLESGERVVLTTLTGVADGLKLRLVNAGEVQ